MITGIRYEPGDGNPFVAWKVLTLSVYRFGSEQVAEDWYPYTLAQWKRHKEYQWERDNGDCLEQGE